MIFKKIIDPLLSSFSKPQWQAKNPQTRIKGIQELLEPGNPELINIALNDNDDRVKVCAINRLADLDTLQTIIMSNISDEVKNAAYNQYNQMLAGEKFPVPALEEREKIIKGCRNSRSLEYLAVHAKETDLRKVAVKKIARDALLGDIALNDKNSDVRLLAANQIGKKSTLERVSKQSRNKDKRVFKTIKDKLNNIIEDEQRPKLLSQEVFDTIDKLEKLLKRNRLLIEKPTFEHLKQRWQEIKNYANEESQQKFEAVSSSIQIKMNELETQKAQQALIIDNLNEIIANLTAEANELLKEKELNNVDQIAEKQKIIGLYKQSWNEQISEIEASEKQQLNTQYQNILKLIEQSEENKEEHSSFELAGNYLKQLNDLSTNTNYLGEKLLNTLFDKFDKEFIKLDPQLNQTKELLANYNSVSQNLKKQLSVQKQSYQELNQQLQEQIQLIAEKVEHGLTDEALKLKSSYINKIEQSQALSNSEKHLFLDKVKDSGNQLNQLNAWKNWANNRKRENLCSKAEDILSSITNSEANISDIYHEYSDQIKDLRSQWKQLSGRSPDELWNRFNHACNQAFEKFEPFFEKQAELRGQNVEIKRQIVTQLKTYVEYMKWPLSDEQGPNSDIDWKQVQTILSQAKKEWNSIKQIDRKNYKPIAKEFDKYTDIIETELKKTWSKNQVLYNELIDKVYALQEILDDDLHSAIAQAKNLQNQWKKIGPVQHFQRKKLWRKFRKGCDIIFKKRDEQNNQKQKQNELILMEKIGLCENLEALNQQDLSMDDLNTAFNDILKLWDGLKHQAKQISNNANQRFEDAVNQFNTKTSRLQDQVLQGQLELLQNKAALCSELELFDHSKNNLDDKLTEYNEQWQNLAELDNSENEKAINRRYQQALEMLTNTDLREQVISNSLQLKESLCLRLELATGHQSPEENSQSRMELQVQKLNSAMKNQDDFQDDDKNKLLIQWLLQPSFEEHTNLQQRFFTIINEDNIDEDK